MKKLTKKTKEIISRIANEHNHRVFGYLDSEDLKSEIWIICIQAYEEYKKELGPLENFLRKTVKNRLVNLFKATTKSVKTPCSRCPFFDLDAPSHCAKFGDNKDSCDKWRHYQLSINSRNSLLNASEEQCERFYTEDATIKLMSEEIKEILRGKLSDEYIHDFNKLASSEDLSRQRFRKLKKEIRRVLIETGFISEDD